MDSDATWIDTTSESSRQLRQAVSDDDANALAKLLPGTDINALHGDGEEGYALLHLAAAKCSTAALRCLLENGAAVDALDRDRFGNSTPLHHAAQAACPDAIRTLLAAGADARATRHEVGTPLKSVLKMVLQPAAKHRECIALFLDKGLDINEAGYHFGMGTVFEEAARLGDVDFAKWLHGRGAHFGNALEVAAGHQRLDMIKWLLQQGVEDAHASALVMACSTGRLDVCEVVLPSAGIATPAELASALTLAVRNSRTPIVSLLLSQGMDVNQPDENGQSARQVLMSSRKPDPAMVELLRAHGVAMSD